MRAAPLLVYPVPCERARSDVFVYRRKRLSPLDLVCYDTRSLYDTPPTHIQPLLAGIGCRNRNIWAILHPQ